MDKMKSLSILRKFLILVIFSLTILMLVFTFFVNQKMRDNYRKIGRDFYLSTEKMFMLGLQDKMLRSQEKDIKSLLKIIAQNRKVEMVRIISPDGIIKFSLDELEQNKKFSAITPSIGSIKLDTISSGMVISLGDFRRAYVTPIPNLQQCHNCHGKQRHVAFLNTTLNLEENFAEIKDTFYQIIYAGLFFVVLVFISITLSFNYLFKKRLSSLQMAFDEVEKGNLDYKLKIKSMDEIGNLEAHFNSMVAKLKLSISEIEELNFERLRHLDKLVNLGELTAGIAHEVNNYMAILYSRLDYLKNEFQENPSCNDFVEDINAMIKQVHNMSSITGNILRHSKIQAFHLDKLDLNDIIKNTLDLLRNTLNKRNILLTFNTIENPVISGDSSQLEQVFVNLISNAMDAISCDGEIKINICRREKNIFVEIEDNGVGIAQENLKNIFMPFFTTKSTLKGSGIGLFIVKKMLDSHDAEITCNSQLNKGTKFTIKFRAFDL